MTSTDNLGNAYVSLSVGCREDRLVRPYLSNDVFARSEDSIPNPRASIRVKDDAPSKRVLDQLRLGIGTNEDRGGLSPSCHRLCVGAREDHAPIWMHMGKHCAGGERYEWNGGRIAQHEIGASRFFF